MLTNTRTYSTSQIPDQGLPGPDTHNRSIYYNLAGWRAGSAHNNRGAAMLLLRQTGSLRVGEVVRYTITYDPAADNIHPIPGELYLKVKNTSAIPLRAAYLHGPYTLYASCYPSTFDANVKLNDSSCGTPQFEPYLKAGGSWNANIIVPRQQRQISGDSREETFQRTTWVVEVVSQIVFSNTASVNYEVLVGRDPNFLETFSATAVSADFQPGQLRDHWSPKTRGRQALSSKGVYNKSITLQIDDTLSLWNTPPFPTFDKEPMGDTDRGRHKSIGGYDHLTSLQNTKHRKKVHLVVLTHGLHSNLGADMLYLKESIDASVRRSRRQFKDCNRGCFEGEPDAQRCGCGCDDEQVIVRGFPGNAVRTERGIQYLGKRLAKYVLFMTYPDQPYIPHKNSKGKPFTTSRHAGQEPINQSASESSQEHLHLDSHAYKITSISFVGHSLGGLIQTYAIAYIQKHSPEFFNLIKPVNFIALATPFLGLSNENPVYIRFALDLGLVGRTGQDLGLSWTAPKLRSGWEAIIGGRGDRKQEGSSDAGSKPLLRILPCGPAHEVLSKFKHRTIYSNVVNDGIVPLRTSCLLFLDWRGLDRVEKARRGNGIVGTMAEWGWAELTGANSKSPNSKFSRNSSPANDMDLAGDQKLGENAESSGTPLHKDMYHLPGSHLSNEQPRGPDASITGTAVESPTGPLSSLFSIFRSKDPAQPSGHRPPKVFKRSQTLAPDDNEPSSSYSGKTIARQHSYGDYGPHTPPKTTILESASDLLMPPLPPAEFIVDPASRPQTIFHDRTYHPEDIPLPLSSNKRRTLTLASSQSKAWNDLRNEDSAQTHSTGSTNESGLRVEEKIARAYHRSLSWRKVLVRLEPDAHNNIIVRRMFTNAYGWPVIKHLVDTHFGQSHTDHAGDTSDKSPLEFFVARDGTFESAQQADILTTGSRSSRSAGGVDYKQINTEDVAISPGTLGDDLQD